MFRFHISMVHCAGFIFSGTMYTVFHKKEPLIFDYNSRISWSIFIIFAPVERGMNTPQYCAITYLIA